MGIALDSDPHVQSTTCDKAFTNQHPPSVCLLQLGEGRQVWEQMKAKDFTQNPFFSSDI